MSRPEDAVPWMQRRPPGCPEAEGPEGRLRDPGRVRDPTSPGRVRDDEQGRLNDRTLLFPERDAGVGADAAPARVETPGDGEDDGPLGRWDTARLRCTPGREQARLCRLDAVKNGWLPIHKRALVCGVALHPRSPEEPPSQEKINTYITITSPKGYTKRWDGVGHTDGNRMEKGVQSMGFRAWRTQSHQSNNQRPVSPSRPPLQRPVSSPGTPIQRPVSPSGPPPPLQRPVSSPGPPLQKPVSSPGPPLQRPVSPSGPQPPLQRPVSPSGPPLQRPVSSPGTPTQRPVSPSGPPPPLQRPVSPSGPPLQRPVSSPGTPIQRPVSPSGPPPPLQRPVSSPGPPPPLQRPVSSPGPPLQRPVSSPGPPLQRPVSSPGPPPPLQRPVSSPGPPLQRPVSSPGPPLQRPVSSPGPPLQRPVSSPGPPLQRPVSSPGPPLQRPVSPSGPPPPLQRPVSPSGPPPPLQRPVSPSGAPPPLQRPVSPPGAPTPVHSDPRNPPAPVTGFSSITITVRRAPQMAVLPSRPGSLTEAGGPVNQAGGPVNQARGSVNQARGPMNQAGGPMNQAGAPMNQAGGPVNQAGAPMNQARGPMNQAGGSVNQAGGPVNHAGGLVNQARGPMNQAEGLVNQARSPMIQASDARPTPAVSSPATDRADGVRSPVIRRRKPVIMKVMEYQRTFCPGDRGPGDRGPGTRPPQFRHSYSAGDDKENVLPVFQTQGASRSSARLTGPAGSEDSALHLDKSMSRSLEEPQVHRSTLSLYLGGPSPTERGKKGGADRPPRAPSLPRELSPPNPEPAGVAASVPKARWGVGRVRDGPPGSSALRSSGSRPGEEHRASTGTLRRGGRSDFRAGRPVSSEPLEGVAHGSAWVAADGKVRGSGVPKDPAAKDPETGARSGSSRVEDAGNPLSSVCGEGVAWRGPPSSRRAGGESGPSRTLHTKSSWTRSFNGSQDCTSNPLTLREALELFRPDFISRSRRRVKVLGQRAQERRAAVTSDPLLGSSHGQRRRNCTKPHPLSDNLFRPRERSISGREMQLRSKRIYNQLPEVTRKKEEEKKKALSQTNRLRADIFKKKLLDQILQRSGD